jgi:hypothetical protein
MQPNQFFGAPILTTQDCQKDLPYKQKPAQIRTSNEQSSKTKLRVTTVKNNFKNFHEKRKNSYSRFGLYEPLHVDPLRALDPPGSPSASLNRLRLASALQQSL